MTGLGMFISFVVGVVVGIVTTALCVASGEDNRGREYDDSRCD